MEDAIELDGGSQADIKHQLLDQLSYLKGGRADRFYPFLLIRSMAGDHGSRPIPAGTDVHHSCDIWIARGAPSDAPDVPPVQIDTAWEEPVLPKNQHTVYAHVWNLGKAPVMGAKVEFFSTRLRQARPPRLLGVARVDLGSRYNPHACHKLVKCPNPVNDIQAAFLIDTSIIARVSCLGDQYDDPNNFDPESDRHLARLDLGAIEVLPHA